MELPHWMRARNLLVLAAVVAVLIGVWLVAVVLPNCGRVSALYPPRFNLVQPQERRVYA